MECYRNSGKAGEAGFMTCYQHPSMPAAARCAQCGKEICAACAVRIGDKIACRDCAEILWSQPAPAAEEPQPEAQAPVAAPAANAAPAPAENPAEAPKETPKAIPQPPAGETSGMPVPVIPSTVAPVAKPAPPATSGPDLGAGGRKAKEPLFAAALSLILPGTGQVYNGQVAKGLVMAAIYLGSIAIVFGGMVIFALGAVRNSDTAPACFCCLPLLVVPLGVLIYAIYDAYNTAEKINFNRPVKEWP